jgi:hypothetical protein
MLQILLFELEALGIGVHHEVFACPREDHDFVFRIRTDGLEKLADGTMIFDAQLDGSARSMRLNENDAVLAALQFVMLFEPLLVFLELWGGDKIH